MTVLWKSVREMVCPIRMLTILLKKKLNCPNAKIEELKSIGGCAEAVWRVRQML
jgi:hypothetical protein